MPRSRRARRRSKLVIGIGVFIVALAVIGAIVTHSRKSRGIRNFRKISADAEAFILSAGDVDKTREGFLNYTMLTIGYLKSVQYSLEDKWLFLHHFKNVGSTYVTTMRQLEVSDKKIKEDLHEMLGQMLDASKKIKGRVIDIIPGFVSASSKWFQTLGLEKA